MPACERCSGQIASDGCAVSAVLDAPNGRKLYLSAKLSASTDALGLHAAMFCESCWLFFLEMFGRRGEQKRIVGV